MATRSLSEVIRAVKDRQHAVVDKVVMDIGRSLVEKSPVGNPDNWKDPEGAPPGYVGGRFRANWQHGEGDYPKGNIGVVDKTGQVSIDRIQSTISDKPAGKVHYIVNNLPYAQKIEEGHSRTQAPAGVVKLTAIEFESIVDAVVRGAKR